MNINVTSDLHPTDRLECTPSTSTPDFPQPRPSPIVGIMPLLSGSSYDYSLWTCPPVRTWVNWNATNISSRGETGTKGSTLPSLFCSWCKAKLNACFREVNAYPPQGRSWIFLRERWLHSFFPQRVSSKLRQWVFFAEQVSSHCRRGGGGRFLKK